MLKLIIPIEQSVMSVNYADITLQTKCTPTWLPMGDGVYQPDLAVDEAELKASGTPILLEVVICDFYLYQNNQTKTSGRNFKHCFNTNFQ
ncbi:hypothetical protein TNCV_2494591 [Trichonephila clavipes]|uniref:Uncharacterized protein n=1 Tax=Trichonephila clavipes TaxID=2585209 RepID=A0A8X6RQS0_TRICX|nr:hypothetical protein TNCV_2494591 [Trichonephila clavipes]